MNTSPLSYFVTAFTTLFIIVDPPGNMPVFLAVTEKLDEELREEVSKKSTIIGMFLLIVFGFFGKFLLRIFGITLNGLRIAGGILLFSLALDILHGNVIKERRLKKGIRHAEADALAVFPMALPIYTGPGAITAAIILNSEANIFIDYILLLLAIIIVYALVRLTHIYSEKILKVLGKTGSEVIARLMAIFLAAISIELIFAGIVGKVKASYQLVYKK